MPGDLRRAFAVLGLRPGASRRAVRNRYKQLVKRWHPDQFHGDPRAFAEAGAQLRVINQAFRTILESTSAAESTVGRKPASAATRQTDAPSCGARLSPEEKQRIVEAMNARESIRERLAERPVDRGASLALVGAYLAFQLCRHLRSIPGTPGWLFGILISPVLLHFAWSDETSKRLFGWFWLAVLLVAVPAFAYYMRGRL